MRALSCKLASLFLLDSLSLSLSKMLMKNEEWVCPLSLDRLMRVGEESRDPTVEIRSWAIEINGGDLMS
jgi:hypothetical protein